jgi:MYXO-CTERM domain-containing protein
LNLSELEPATVVVLILWLGLAALVVSFLRRRLG